MTIFEKISEKIKKTPEEFQPYEDFFYLSLEGRIFGGFAFKGTF